MKISLFSLLISSSLMISCSSIQKLYTPKAEKLSKSKVTKAKIKFGMSDKEVQVFRFKSSSIKKTYQDQQILNAKEEEVDFTVQNTATAVNPKKGVYSFQVKTLSKDGFVNLRDLAFPEMGEKIDYQVNSRAQVLGAGRFPKDSVYYIPSVVLPKSEVSVGDTWDYSSSYVLLESGIPLKLELTSILKSFVNCGLKLCADIEISGSVSIATKMKSVNYASEMAGRMLVAVEDGRILWQRIRSGEKMETEGGGEILIYSCIESKQKSPSAFASLRNKALDCKPSETKSLYVEALEYR